MAGCGSLSPDDLRVPSNIGDMLLSKDHPATIRLRWRMRVWSVSGAIPPSSLDTLTTQVGQILWLVWAGEEASSISCQRMRFWHQAQTIKR